jgi:ATP diphosphatase
VQAKLDEELAELRDCAPDDRSGLTEELGDLLFTVASLARHLGVDPETALAAANRKFERRFRHVEAATAPTPGPADENELARMEAAWAAAKRLERRSSE